MEAILYGCTYLQAVGTSLWLILDKPPLVLAASHRSARSPTQSKVSVTAHVWRNPALLVPVSQEMYTCFERGCKVATSQVAGSAMLDNSMFGL